MNADLHKRLHHWMHNVYGLVKSNALEQGTVFDVWLHDELDMLLVEIRNSGPDRAAFKEEASGDLPVRGNEQ